MGQKDREAEALLARIAELEAENAELKRLIGDEPRTKTLLPPWAQRLWESCNDLVEKAAFKQIWRHLEAIEKRLGEAEADRDRIRECVKTHHDQRGDNRTFYLYPPGDPR